MKPPDYHNMNAHTHTHPGSAARWTKTKEKQLVLSGVELKLTEQRKMVRREMRIGAANYLALF